MNKNDRPKDRPPVAFPTERIKSWFPLQVVYVVFSLLFIVIAIWIDSRYRIEAPDFLNPDKNIIGKQARVNGSKPKMGKIKWKSK